MPATNPTADDLQRYLAAAGLIDVSPASPFTFVDLAQRVASAQSDFEGRIGRTLLATLGSRTYDPPTTTVLPQRLFLNADLAGNPTALSIGGIVKVLDADYFMGSENSDADGLPFQWIEFPNYVTAVRKSIVVTGYWGYALTIPDGAWAAMLARAAYLSHPELAAAITQGMIRFTDEGFGANFGREPMDWLRDQWDAIYEAGVARYRRLSVDG